MSPISKGTEFYPSLKGGATNLIAVYNLFSRHGTLGGDWPDGGGMVVVVEGEGIGGRVCEVFIGIPS